MKPEYDVVVVGSGYGGSVAAMRASALKGEDGVRQSVCLLERGREFLPGDFPDEIASCLADLQVTMQHKDDVISTAGCKTALFDVRKYDELAIVQGCGLGGTSLINANVAMRADERVYQSPEWPEVLRDEFKTGFTKYFKAATDMLGSTLYKYKDTRPLTKADALRRATVNATDSPDMAQAKWGWTPINVTFEETMHRTSGLTQPACNNCGDCVTGCNVGAKNTTAMNYLPAAWVQGTSIFCNTEVRRISRQGGMWVVHYRMNTAKGSPNKFHNTEMWVRAKTVVLAAGTLGTNEIMLRSKTSTEQPLSMSNFLGSHYSGNGDTLGAATFTDQKVQNFGAGHGEVDSEFQSGPCITSIMDNRRKRKRKPSASPSDIGDLEDLDKGFIVQDCAVPGALRAASGMVLPLHLIASKFAGISTPEGLSEIFKEIAKGEQGTLENLEAFLVMSHDRASDADGTNCPEKGWGKISLSTFDPKTDPKALRQRAIVKWPGVAKLENWKIAEDGMRKLGKALGAADDDFIPNPLLEQGIAVSVHSLGGCVMSENCDTGVVNHKGQVFRGDTPASEAVHEGLYIMDGSIVPRSCGINPLLTITALSERCMEHFQRDNKLVSITDEHELRCRQYPRPMMKPSHGFILGVEEMSGRLDPKGEPVMENEDRRKCNTVLQVTLPDLPALEKDSGFSGNFIEGTLTCKLFSPDALQISDTRCQILAQDPDVVDGRRTVYQFKMTTTEGRVYYFDGYRKIQCNTCSPFQSLWQDTTRMMVTITSGPQCPWTAVTDAEKATAKSNVTHTGVLTVGLANLIRQISTHRSISKCEDTRSNSTLNRLLTFLCQHVVSARYKWLFFKNITKTYLLVNTLNAPSRAMNWTLESPDRYRTLQCKLTKEYYIEVPTDDGPVARVTLRRYQGGSKGPVILMHGVGVSSRIFLPNTIQTNLVEYLFNNGYDVWLPEMRVSCDAPKRLSAKTCNLDTLASDWPLYVQAVRENARTNDSDPLPTVQIFAHCLGALTCSMALLKGMKGMDGVRSVVLSQVGWYTSAPIGKWMYCTFPSRPRWMRQQGVDPTDNSRWCVRWFMRAYSIATRRKEGCSQPTCHHANFVYGSLHLHANLNDATHRHMRSMFGYTNLDTLKHMEKTVREGQVVNRAGHDVYATNEKLHTFVRKQIPVHIIHGGRNGLWSRRGAEKMIKELRQIAKEQHHLPEDIYSSMPFADYGHHDCIYGKNASIDIYPNILEQLDKHNARSTPKPADPDKCCGTRTLRTIQWSSKEDRNEFYLFICSAFLVLFCYMWLRGIALPLPSLFAEVPVCKVLGD